MENRLKNRIAAIDAKFTKMLDKTETKIESVKKAMKSHVLATPALTVSRAGLVAKSG